MMKKIFPGILALAFLVTQCAPVAAAVEKAGISQTAGAIAGISAPSAYGNSSTLIYTISLENEIIGINQLLITARFDPFMLVFADESEILIPNGYLLQEVWNEATGEYKAWIIKAENSGLFTAPGAEPAIKVKFNIIDSGSDITATLTGVQIVEMPSPKQPVTVSCSLAPAAAVTEYAPYAETQILSVAYSGFTYLVYGCSANVPVTVTANNPNGLRIFAGVFADGFKLGKAEIINGNAVVKVPAINGETVYIAAWFEEGEPDMATAAKINMRKLLPDVWVPEFGSSSGGITTVIFADKISYADTATVKIDGIPVTKFWVDGNILCMQSDTSSGQIIEIKGVKYPDLFPSYSFTFIVAA